MGMSMKLVFKLSRNIITDQINLVIEEKTNELSSCSDISHHFALIGEIKELHEDLKCIGGGSTN